MRQLEGESCAAGGCDWCIESWAEFGVVHSFGNDADESGVDVGIIGVTREG